ncbi:AI-2E family transporter [Candidatus Roizmanbacteria bacterium]|nr:AI-2E family transporter [Candidatus Roizmanbacteria bacterium]
MEKSTHVLKHFLNLAEVRRNFIVILPIVFLLLMLNPHFKNTVTPFLLGGLTAYIFMPVVRLCTRYLRLPHIFSVGAVILALLLLVVFSFTQIVKITNFEIKQFREEAIQMTLFSSESLNSLPDWTQEGVNYFSQSIRDFSRVKQSQAIPILRNTVEGIIALFAYFVTTFYFLKDGEKIGRRLSRVPAIHRAHKAIQNYFRGLMILVVIMTSFTYVFLRVLDIKFAFLLSLFTGFAEIMPYIGPVAAGGLTCVVAFLTGLQAFGYPPLITILIIAVGYFLLRQLEDFFVIPVVIGRSIELHPLVILLTTLLAGKFFGFLGLLLGVPFVGTYKVLLEYWWSETEG